MDSAVWFMEYAKSSNERDCPRRASMDTVSSPCGKLDSEWFIATEPKPPESLSAMPSRPNWFVPVWLTNIDCSAIQFFGVT